MAKTIYKRSQIRESYPWWLLQQVKWIMRGIPDMQENMAHYRDSIGGIDEESGKETRYKTETDILNYVENSGYIKAFCTALSQYVLPEWKSQVECYALSGKYRYLSREEEMYIDENERKRILKERKENDDIREYIEHHIRIEYRNLQIGMIKELQLNTVPKVAKK